MVKIYIDENFAPQLAKALDVIQQHLNLQEKIEVRVLSIGEAFGRGAKDEDWIPKAGEENSVVITQDLNIHRTRHQNELYKKHGLGVFFFKPPSKGYSFWEMLEQLVKHWPEIKKKLNTKRPFAYLITPKKLQVLK